MLTVAHRSAFKVRGRLVGASPTGRGLLSCFRLVVPGDPDPEDTTSGAAKGDRHSKCVSCKACFMATEPGMPLLT